MGSLVFMVGSPAVEKYRYATTDKPLVSSVGLVGNNGTVVSTSVVSGDIETDVPVQLVEKALKDKSGKSQYLIAQIYKDGTRSIKPDADKADDWFAQSEELGFDLALYDRAMLLKQSYSFAVREEAISLFAQAAKNGHPESQYELANAYYDGIVLEQDFKAAHYWYSKASEKGIKEATYALGIMHQLGKGVPAEPSEAMEYFKIASSQEHAMSQYILGMGYYSGVGVEQDFEVARDLFRRSMVGGNIDAWKALRSMSVT